MSFSMFSMDMAGWPAGRSSALLQGACQGVLGCKRLISFNKQWRPSVVSHQSDAFFLCVAPLWGDNWKRLLPARPDPVGAAMAWMQFVGWVERSETHRHVICAGMMGFASLYPSYPRGRPEPGRAPVSCPACLHPWPAVTDLLAALLLGIIEGITEFLPISSTGHLLIAQHWLGHRSDLFNISIQAGAILAIALIYRQRLWDLAMGFLGRRAPAGHDPAGISLDPAQARDYALKLGVAFGVTCVLGLAVKNADRIGALFGQDWQAFELPEATTPIAWALILGGVWMVVAEHFAARRAKALGERTAISWTVAILVGIERKSTRLN